MMRDERVYRVLLRAYPARFRQEYEHELMLVFREQRRDGGTSDRWYWTALLIDLMCSIAREWHEEVTSNSPSGIAHLRKFGLAAVLVAAFEVLNTAAEVQAGGFAGRDVLSQAGIVVTMLTMTALLVSGIGLVRGRRAAAPSAGIAAAGCIASFAFIGVVRPMLSVLAMLAGIGFPVALLLWLLVNRGRGASPAQMGNAVQTRGTYR
ncbi:MAG: hypothetical protein ABJE47_10605 [bacterium]